MKNEELGWRRSWQKSKSYRFTVIDLNVSTGIVKLYVHSSVAVFSLHCVSAACCSTIFLLCKVPWQNVRLWFDDVQISWIEFLPDLVISWPDFGRRARVFGSTAETHHLPSGNHLDLEVGWRRCWCGNCFQRLCERDADRKWFSYQRRFKDLTIGIRFLLDQRSDVDSP